MTSEVLRKLLVAGAAVAALSVGACKKADVPAAASDTSAAASDTGAASDASSAAASDATAASSSK
jgi:hypothetical protein